MAWWTFILVGLAIGAASSFTGLGGGFLIVPFLLWAGFASSKAVGTSAYAIFIIAISSIIAHHRLGNIDLKVGLLIGIGGVVGAQIGAMFVSQVSTDMFRRIFAVILAALSVYLFIKK